MLNTKLIFLDIDGTLNVSGKNISQPVIKALLQAQKNGHKIFISTGRLKSSISESVKSIPFNGGIFSAGRHLVVDGKIIVDEYMLPQIVQQIQELFRMLKIKQSIETPYGVYVDWYSNKWSISYDEWQQLTKIIGGPKRHNIEEYQNKPTYKIVFIVDSEECANRVADSIQKIAITNNFTNLSTVIFGRMIKDLPLIIGEISDSTINKGTALIEICKYYNVSIQNTIAFGDSMNDASIIKQAGLGIAMANSELELLEIADKICDSVENDGIVDAFKQLNLI